MGSLSEGDGHPLLFLHWAKRLVCLDVRGLALYESISRRAK